MLQNFESELVETHTCKSNFTRGTHFLKKIQKWARLINNCFTLPIKSLFWSEHIGWDNPSVKLFVRDAVFFGRLSECGSLLVRILGDGGGLIVSDVEVQS